ncbi:DUF2807 domain-containing protein [Mucilaginibacter terrigena]|uniref:DUF2807 domain-containing protein n=1 Tax=Mucilaginibacter terrigena TaxID=2492395 RepID=A0A4Q5LHH1_9SPHI|nr:head GIN domain-containing protein [Mucilaginibacter terrigena]RYU86582.1 DUF2807 domain-containing protein [Mucilaginibacter terrigena]
MKNSNFKILLLVAAVSITLFSSCRRFRCVKGNGNVKTEARKMVDFTKVDLSGGYKVTLKQDSSQSITITTDDNLLKYIETTVEGGTLRVHNRRNVCGSGETTIIIGVKNLDRIGASGAVEIASNGRLNTKDLNIDLSGSTKIDMDLNAANVRTDASGSSEIYLKGQAASHDVDMSGSGKVEALDFVVGKYKISTSGASECKINVLNELDVHTSGSSDISYRGNPGKVNNDQSGASSIKKLD